MRGAAPMLQELKRNNLKCATLRNIASAMSMILSLLTRILYRFNE